MTARGGPPRLHILMRSHGSDNRKMRPPFFDKTACLASLVRAAEAVSPAPSLLFVNDGPIPAARSRLMAAAGEVLEGEFGSNRSSYRATLSLAVERTHDDADLVWFAEDDYLYDADAFLRLLDAAEKLPQADYFSLYVGEVADRQVPQVGRAAGSQPPAGRPASPGQPVDWAPAVSTTSTFGVRHRQLREDLGLLRLMPYTGGAFDHTTCLTVQGRYPFTGAELVEDLVPFGRSPATEWPRRLVRGAVRAPVGLRALRRPSRRRTLYGPTRDLATHLELGAFDDSEDWESVSRSSLAWASERERACER
jgi:hypothetical protein